jgi:hypothetical protein
MALDTTERISCSAPWQQHLDLDISYLSTAILNLGTYFLPANESLILISIIYIKACLIRCEPWPLVFVLNFGIGYLYKVMLNSLCTMLEFVSVAASRTSRT